MEAKIRMPRFLIVDDDVRSRHEVLSLRGSWPAQAPARRSLAFLANLARADKLHLCEVRDPLARRVAPGPPRASRIEDHIHAALGQDLGGQSKGPVEERLLRLRRPLPP